MSTSIIHHGLQRACRYLTPTQYINKGRPPSGMVRGEYKDAGSTVASSTTAFNHSAESRYGYFSVDGKSMVYIAPAKLDAGGEYLQVGRDGGASRPRAPPNRPPGKQHNRRLLDPAAGQAAAPDEYLRIYDADSIGGDGMYMAVPAAETTSGSARRHNQSAVCTPSELLDMYQLEATGANAGPIVEDAAAKSALDAVQASVRMTQRQARPSSVQHAAFQASAALNEFEALMGAESIFSALKATDNVEPEPQPERSEYLAIKPEVDGPGLPPSAMADRMGSWALRFMEGHGAAGMDDDDDVASADNSDPGNCRPPILRINGTIGNISMGESVTTEDTFAE